MLLNTPLPLRMVPNLELSAAYQTGFLTFADHSLYSEKIKSIQFFSDSHLVNNMCGRYTLTYEEQRELEEFLGGEEESCFPGQPPPTHVANINVATSLQ